MFWSMVGHASFHTAGKTGPSTRERSNCLVGWGAAAMGMEDRPICAFRQG